MQQFAIPITTVYRSTQMIIQIVSHLPKCSMRLILEPQVEMTTLGDAFVWRKISGETHWPCKAEVTEGYQSLGCDCGTATIV